MKKKISIIIAILLAIAGCVWFFGFAKPKEAYALRTSNPQEGELELSVTASGNIQPVTKVEVGTQVSGIVTKIYVDFNSQVNEGQLLAELDKATLSERVRQAKASFENAESDLKLATLSYERTQSLYDQKASTPASLEEAENRLANARGKVVTTKADYQQALVNLSYAEIYSPISGRVLNRAVDEGQTVAASFNTPTLFTIANDLTKMQVEANVDEADIGRIKVGQKAIFDVDTYPGEVFHGTVSQIRLEPTVSANVVTYTVIIDAPNPDEKLFPGMTANTTITTQSSRGIIVPAEALYFNPDPEKIRETILASDKDKNSEGGNRIWVRAQNSIRPVSVNVGESDGVNTIIKSGIQGNDEIILGIEAIDPKSKTEGSSFFPKPPKGGPGGGPGAMMH
ncbi:MAG: efflux RND transporter periplasmic adaptor subunit [Bacteroidales bacterium]